MGGYESRACIAVFFFFFYSRCPRCDVSQQLHERKRVPYPLEKKKNTHIIYSNYRCQGGGGAQLLYSKTKRKTPASVPSKMVSISFRVVQTCCPLFFLTPAAPGRSGPQVRRLADPLRGALPIQKVGSLPVCAMDSTTISTSSSCEKMDLG